MGESSLSVLVFKNQIINETVWLTGEVLIICLIVCIVVCDSLVVHFTCGGCHVVSNPPCDSSYNCRCT